MEFRYERQEELYEHKNYFVEKNSTMTQYKERKILWRKFVVTEITEKKKRFQMKH